MKTAKGELMMSVLKGVGYAGLTVGGVLCPGILRVLPRNLQSTTMPVIRQTVHRLNRKGWILMKETPRGWQALLSKRGKAELAAYESGSKKIRAARTWDKKWRLLIFDIPESRRLIREKVRRTLQAFGFHRLQDSVWAHPYECKEILQLLQIRHGVRFEALYVLVERMDGDGWLRKQFGLK